jgi:hypothetical protein
MLKFVNKLFQISTGDNAAQQNGSTSTTSLDKSKATDSPKLEEFDQNVITLTEQHSGIMHFSIIYTQ